MVVLKGKRPVLSNGALSCYMILSMSDRATTQHSDGRTCLQLHCIP